MIRTLVALLACAVAAPAAAEVALNTGDAFTIRNVAEVAAPPARVYAALGQPGRWWQSSHTWSGDAKNLSMALEAGGCFCERWNGNAVEHLRVVTARPGELLRLSGALGPLQGEGVSGALTFELKPKGAGTEVIQTYTVRGFSAAEAARWAPAVDGVLGAQLRGLEKLLETGAP